LKGERERAANPNSRKALDGRTLEGTSTKDYLPNRRKGGGKKEANIFSKMERTFLNKQQNQGISTDLCNCRGKKKDSLPRLGRKKEKRERGGVFAALPFSGRKKRGECPILILVLKATLALHFWRRGEKKGEEFCLCERKRGGKRKACFPPLKGGAVFLLSKR